MAVIGVAQLLLILDMTIVNVALPTAQGALHIADSDRHWVITAYTLAFGGLLLLGGRIADVTGRKRAFVAGLVGFAVASAAFVLAGEQDAIAAARFGQGAAAAAFSPAAGTLVARFSPTDRRGRAFGTYGAWKGLGYTTGPLLGGGLVALGGFRLLFTTLAVLGLGVAAWAALVVPAAPPLPRARETVLGLTRRLAQPSFLQPVLALAGATAALSAGVGFLPVRGAQANLGPLATGAATSLLALAAALVQPRAGRAHDTGRLPRATGMTGGLALAAVGFAAAVVLPGLPGLLLAGTAVGIGTGLVTPLGFAALAATAPPGRLGQTMGAGEVGRELGDAGGPLLVGTIAGTAGLGLGAGLLGLAATLLLAASATSMRRPISQ